MDRLTLEIDEGTMIESDAGFSRVHFYTSSIRHKETDEKLLSVVTSGRGMRLNRNQVTLLRDRLNEFLND